MRTRLKLLCSLFSAVFVFSAMSMAVVADVQLVDSGDAYNYFSWKYYSNDELVVECKDIVINLANIDSYDFYENIKTITFDLTNIGDHYSVRFAGEDCPASNINVVGNSASLRKMAFWDFNNLSQGKCINFQSDYDLEEMELYSLNISSDDFIENFDLDSLKCLEITNCDLITDISYSGNELYVSDSDLISSITVSGSNEIVSLGYDNSLTTLNLGLLTNDVSINTCEKLETLVLSESLEHLWMKNCPLLTELALPSSSSEIYMFDLGLTELTINPFKEDFRVRCDSLEKATITSGCTTISDKMFYECGSLSEVSIPNTVTSIGESAFRCCYSLKTIDLPDSITTISPLAFGYSGLESVEFPSGLTFIEYYSFVNCKSLKSVTIPTSVTCIDKEAFYGCSKLTDVYYEGTEEEWNQIEVDPDDITLEEALNNATIHFGSSQPVQQSGWVQDGNKWLYYDENGSKVTGWKQIDGTWYDFDSNGIMLTGWQESGSDWYYMNGSGAMVTGWIQSSGKWYFMDKSSGAMKTGWLNDGGTWYYFNGSGAMVTGWVEISDKWYYFESSGAMKTGWIQSSGDWYCLKSDGSMAAGEYVRGYWLNANGKWTYKPVAKWVKDSVGWYYIDDANWYVKSDSVMIDGKVYDFDSRGYCTNP